MEWIFSVIIILVAFVAFVAGWISSNKSHERGYNEGWEDAAEYTEQKMTKEFVEAFPEPFRQRLHDAGRTYAPRPDSAGPIRTHQARIRGDFRLPNQKPPEERLGENEPEIRQEGP